MEKIYEPNAIESFQKTVKIFKYLEKLSFPSNIKFYDYGVENITLNGITKKRKYAIIEYGTHGILYDALEKTRNGLLIMFDNIFYYRF